MSDGMIEVIGMDSFDLAWTQIGCHAKSVCQGKKVVVTTSKMIHMKVDGEPVLMKPCTITITLDHEKAPRGNMLKNKRNYNNRIFTGRSSGIVQDMQVVDEAARKIQQSWRSHRTTARPTSM